jgi:hypothetical protein
MGNFVVSGHFFKKNFIDISVMEMGFEPLKTHCIRACHPTSAYIFVLKQLATMRFKARTSK